jgi:tellurite resistance protein TehA-like permease
MIASYCRHAAISVLAGSTLILRASTWPILEAYLPFLKSTTIFFWAAATWWMPFLVAMTAWRYLVRKDKFRYEPALWGMVFPLGMYASATFELIRAESLPFLSSISSIFMFVALGAWLCTFSGFVWHLSSRLAAENGGS